MSRTLTAAGEDCILAFSQCSSNCELYYSMLETDCLGPMKYIDKEILVSASQGLFGKIVYSLFAIVIAVFSVLLTQHCSSNKTIQKEQETTQEKVPQITVGLNIGDRVISKNTTDDSGKKGVHIRYTAEIRSDNHKGWLFDGAIGEIIDGPIYEDGFVWWEVSWDPGLGTSKINCGNNDSCTGWIAETINKALILNKM